MEGGLHCITQKRKGPKAQAPPSPKKDQLGRSNQEGGLTPNLIHPTSLGRISLEGLVRKEIPPFQISTLVSHISDPQCQNNGIYWDRGTRVVSLPPEGCLVLLHYSCLCLIQECFLCSIFLQVDSVFQVTSGFYNTK